MKSPVIYIFCFMVACSVCAQEQNPEMIIDDNINSYLKAVNNYAVIYTGKEEPVYNVRTLNHPYLDTYEFRIGELSYEGRVYKDAMLRLNHDIGELIIMNPNKTLSIIVPKDRLDYAIIDSLYILYHKPVSADGMELQEGFYVRTYKGDHEIWRRETCFLNTNIKDHELEYFFEKKLRIYIYKDGVYNLVKNKGSLLNFFASKKKELKKYIKQNGLSFNKDPDMVIVYVTRYYDNLNK